MGAKNSFELKGIPTLRILDYQKSIDFYTNYLGFTVDWEHRFGPKEPVYMQVSLRGLVLHLSENKRFDPGIIVFVDTKQIRSLHKTLCKRNQAVTPEVEATPWQTLQMEIEDPAGNLLRFNETVVD